jgi:polysaccharide chain length determinant protein (PEP-CTERM system associated)
MQPIPESYNIQRRPLDVEDYIEVLRRHRGWIFGPTFAGLVIGVAVAFFWPDTYVSEATMRILPPQVPEKYVATNVNTEMAQRVQAMAQTILSRARLQDMINANNLYPSKRNRLPMEDLIEEMQKNIDITPLTPLRDQAADRVNSAAFQIKYSYENRYLAQKVVQQLVSRFIDESITTRASQSVMTTNFLKDKLESAKGTLDAIENRLTDYKIRNTGKLPDQLPTNLQQLRTLETQLASVNASISRVTQEKVLLESQGRIYRDQLQQAAPVTERPAALAVKNERLMQLERQIVTLETSLNGMKEQYKETHPDVRRLSLQIGVLKKERDGLLKEEEKRVAAAPPQKAAPPVKTRESQEIEASIQKIQSLMQAKDMEMDQYVKEQARLDGTIRQFQSRIESTPIGEREYIELTRDYALAKQKYDDLSMKAGQSEIATDLESRKQGETLELLDNATLPATPTEPKRWLIILVGTAFGMMLGLFLAGGREVKDTSLKNLKDIRAYTNLTVLGSIPLLENDLVVKRRRRLTWLAWSSASIVGVLIMVGSVFHYYTNA